MNGVNQQSERKVEQMVVMMMMTMGRVIMMVMIMGMVIMMMMTMRTLRKCHLRWMKHCKWLGGLDEMGWITV